MWIQGDMLRTEVNHANVRARRPMKKTPLAVDNLRLNNDSKGAYGDDLETTTDRTLCTIACKVK